MSLAPVQSCATADSTSLTQPTSNWTGTPGVGNLMVAFGYIRNNHQPAPTNGWKLAVTPVATTNWILVCYAKYAGASEPKIQAVDSGTGFQEWGLFFSEISGVTGNLWQDLIKVTFGAQNGATSSLALGSIVPKAATTLLIAAIAGQFPASTDTITWPGSPWTADASFVSPVGDAFGVFNFAAGGHQVAPSGAQTCTPTTSVNVDAWTGGYIELGFNAEPAFDGPIATAVDGASSAITSLSASLSTFSADDVVIVHVSLSAFASSGVTVPAVTSITASGLTFTKRYQANPEATSTVKSDFEVWWAPVAAPFSGAITVNISGLANTNNVAAMTAFAIGGAHDYTAPFDSEPGLPYADVSPQSWSTLQADDFVFAIAPAFSPSSLTTPVISGGVTWTSYQAGNGSAFGGAGCTASTDFSNTSSAQTGVSTTSSSGVLYIDAITASSASSIETATGAMAFGPAAFAGAGSAFNAMTGGLAFGPVGFAAASAPFPNAAGSLAFGPVQFAAEGARNTGSQGVLAFGPVDFTAEGAATTSSIGALAFGPVAFAALSGIEDAGGALAFGPVQFQAAGRAPPSAAGAMGFGPIAFAAGGGGRVMELDVAALVVVPVSAQVMELDVAALAVPGDVAAWVSELDVAVLAVPTETTVARVAELDVAVLAYIGPCLTHRCTVWKISLRNGTVFAFTSLDTDIEWNGTTYRTCNSLSTTASASSSELKDAGDVELIGILSSDAISDEDLYSGVFDDAYVETWVIPYDGQPDDQAPFRQAAGWMGKVTRGEFNFTAEVVGPGGRLGQAAVVDFYTPGCRWDFGVLDADGIGCPVDGDSFAIANIPVTGSVLRSEIMFTAETPGPVDGVTAIFDAGQIVWQTGRNAGVTCMVETVDFGAQALSLWDLAPYPPAVGDLFTLKPGCPKTPDGCDNYGVYQSSFGGFTDVPGPDALQSNADSLFT